jgi:hypothetical protein
VNSARKTAGDRPGASAQAPFSRPVQERDRQSRCYRSGTYVRLVRLHQRLQPGISGALSSPPPDPDNDRVPPTLPFLHAPSGYSHPLLAALGRVVQGGKGPTGHDVAPGTSPQIKAAASAIKVGDCRLPICQHGVRKSGQYKCRDRSRRCKARWYREQPRSE